MHRYACPLRISEDGIEERGKRLPAWDTNDRERADETTNHGENRQQNHRNCHHAWGFINIVYVPDTGSMIRLLLFIFSMLGSPSPTVGACKDTEDQPEHVECRQACCEDTQNPEDIVQPAPTRFGLGKH